MTNRNEYNAFGELSVINGSSNNSIGYTGQRLDSETGLMALGNGERYYSPSYARFIQQDSVVGVSDMPQSLNRFSYVHNNPNKFTDPSGNIIPLIIYGLALIAVTALTTSTIESHSRHNLEGEEQGWAKDDPRRSWGAALGDGSGMTKIVNAAVGQDVYTGRDLGWKERVWQGTIGTIEVIGNATAVGGLVFKAGSLVINTARGGSELLNLTRGAWQSIKNFEPAIADAKAVIDAIRNPFQTLKAGWQAVKGVGQVTWQAGKELFKDGVGQAAKRTVKNAWEFTKERLNPFNYERDGWNVNFIEKSPKYKTIALHDNYEREEFGDVFGTEVKYLNEVEREPYRLFVHNRKLYDSCGNLFDTTTARSLHNPDGGKAIFVMDETGKIYASKVQIFGYFHHSSFLSGKPVASAGELLVEKGIIKEISRKSGHYRPLAEINSQIMKELGRKGVNTKGILETEGF